MSEQSLYERLGGAFAIAAVIDHFSDAVVQNPIVGQQSKNPALREWHTQNLGRLPGLKFMRTLWVCNVAGGPFEYTPTVPGGTICRSLDLPVKNAVESPAVCAAVKMVGRVEVPQEAFIAALSGDTEKKKEK